ncbi:MAG: M20/M25/M40 family metallo-hydrolase [Eudoraea sp.]|nr:M20/M25/M40 family metallo-hydrolase [Eudoraea sp.]
MKNKILIFLAALLAACGTSKINQSNPATDANAPEGVKGSIVLSSGGQSSGTAIVDDPVKAISAENFSDETRMKDIMNFLASDELKGRDSGSEGIEKAAGFIEEIFKQNNVAPYFNSYKDTLSNFTKPAYNIVGLVEGNDADLKDEFILIGAHYDHIGIIKAAKKDSTAISEAAISRDTIANGANDNASGTSTVLELARYFGNSGNTKRSLIFALFSAEEKGLLGARHLAERLKEKGIDLYTMLNFEMTGVPLVGRDYFMYVTGYNRSNLAEISNKYAEEQLIGFLETAQEFNLFQRSDNFPFHEVFNVPSQTFCTFDFTNFNHYHKVGDEVSEMDFEHMAAVVNRLIPVIEGISNAEEKEIKYE